MDINQLHDIETELCKKLDDIKGGRIQCSKGVEHIAAMAIAAVKRIRGEEKQSDGAKMDGEAGGENV